jgi:hypothetical protein
VDESVTTPDDAAPAEGPDGKPSANGAGQASALAGEAGRLLEAIQQWVMAHAEAQHQRQPTGFEDITGVEPHGPAEHADSPSEARAPDEPADGPSEHADGPIRRQVCQVCPLCQLAGLLDGVRPDVAGLLGETAANLFAVLRTAIDTQERQWSGRPSAGVERIDIE